MKMAGQVYQRKWTPQTRFVASGQQGFFSSPVRFWMAVVSMLALFFGYVSYLNSESSLNQSHPQPQTHGDRQMTSLAVSLADLERVAAANPLEEDEEDDSYNSGTQQQQTIKSSSAASIKKNPVEEKDADTVEAENSAAASDLLSNEVYPTYELPKGGKSLKEVQDEVDPSDVPDTASEVNEEEEQKQSLEDDDIFEDAAAYKQAPHIQSMPESASIRYREIVLQHERYYRLHPSRLYVPKLKKTAKLTIAQFAERFLKHSQPVIIPFEAMRHLGFTTRSYTLDELLELYPKYKRTFIYKYGNPGPGELDLGPAVWALKQGDALRKTATGRNFPRNTKITLEKLARLNIQNPPYIIPGTPMLAPSLWFATVSSSTKLHSDCCDNYAMMISGTKRWTVAPPNEARILTPSCSGGLCWVKKLEHPDEHASTDKQKELADKLQKVTFDLGPNEMLYLPTGWFHHVENVGPTIMVNFWTKGGAGFLKFLDGSMIKTLADMEKEESSQRSI